MKTFPSLLFIALLAGTVPLAAYAQSDSLKCFAVEGVSDHSFGIIEQDTPVEHTFIMKNNCSEIVEVEKAQASCGCTAAVLSEKTIQPGKEAKIQVKFTPPKGTKGKVSKTVSVYLKGQTQPHSVLRFSADVKTDLDIEPMYIQLLNAEIGKTATNKIKVKNATTEAIDITEAVISVTTYTDTAGNGKTVAIPLKVVSVSPATASLKPAETIEFTVEITPEYKGSLNGSVRLKTKKNETSIQIQGGIKGPPAPPVLTIPENTKK